MNTENIDYKINDIGISISAYALNEEVSYMWKRVKRIAFYNDFGYNLSLPMTDEMNNIISLILDNRLDGSYKQIFENEIRKVYHLDFYAKGIERIKNSIEVVKEINNIFKRYESKWDFKLFSKYNIRLTRFGPGGSYDPDEGKIIIKTKKDKIASNTASLEAILLHEMVHIGIEDVIVKKYDLSHEVKERIVDNFMMYHFKSVLPNYKMWSKGDSRIDKYLDEEGSWDDLPRCIEKFLIENK